MDTQNRMITLEDHEWEKYKILTPGAAFECLYEYSLMDPIKQHLEDLPVEVHHIFTLVDWNDFKMKSREDPAAKRVFYEAYKLVIAKLRTGVTLKHPLLKSLYRGGPNSIPTTLRPSNELTSSQIAHGKSVCDQLKQLLSD